MQPGSSPSFTNWSSTTSNTSITRSASSGSLHSLDLPTMGRLSLTGVGSGSRLAITFSIRSLTIGDRGSDVCANTSSLRLVKRKELVFGETSDLAFEEPSSTSEFKMLGKSKSTLGLMRTICSE